MTRTFRDLIFQACLALGAGAGLWWALHQPAGSPDAYVAGIALGALAGACLGVVLARQLRPSRSAPRRADARWKRARYPARCHACRRPVAAGDRILHAPGHLLCEPCA
jgi:hypothetical protein